MTENDESGIYALFVFNELFEFIDNITNKPDNAFSKIKRNLPGFKLKIGGNKLKVLDCKMKILNCTKPTLPSLDIIPSTTYNDYFLTNNVPSINYVSLFGNDVTEAYEDIAKYVDKKTKTIDEVISMLTEMKSNLNIYKNSRNEELKFFEDRITRRKKFEEWRTKQKLFNSSIKRDFMTTKKISSDSIKIEPLESATLKNCKAKYDYIINILNILHPKEYVNIKDIIEKFTCVIVIDADKNSIINVFDIKENKIIWPKKSPNEPI